MIKSHAQYQLWTYLGRAKPHPAKPIERLTLVHAAPAANQGGVTVKRKVTGERGKKNMLGESAPTLKLKGERKEQLTEFSPYTENMPNHLVLHKTDPRFSFTFARQAIICQQLELRCISELLVYTSDRKSKI